LDDLIVGAWSASPSGQSDAGKSYVVFGKTNSSAINLSVIADTSNPTGGFVINGEEANDYSGPVGLLASAITLRSMALLLALPNTT
jgi:hypothetical protein